MTVPGPAALGRGVIIEAGGAIPAPWIAAPVITIDDVVLKDPAASVARLHEHWSRRDPVVVELAVDPGRFRAPQTIEVPVWQLAPSAEPWFDRLHFLVWNNNYQARGNELIWWWSRKAVRVGAAESLDGAGDVTLADGSAAWIDGGPRRPPRWTLHRTWRRINGPRSRT
ncbi:MAG: hypothetical protein GX643_00230 [Acidimicrobiales bacterium]|nr:hypothetical protein [Acidimicrobiales bacterium]